MRKREIEQCQSVRITANVQLGKFDDRTAVDARSGLDGDDSRDSFAARVGLRDAAFGPTAALQSVIAHNHNVAN